MTNIQEKTLQYNIFKQSSLMLPFRARSVVFVLYESDMLNIEINYYYKR